MKSALLTAAALAFTATATAASANVTCRIGATAGVTATYTEAGAAIPGLGGASVGLDGFGTQGAQFGGLVGCDLAISKFVIGAFADYVHQDLEWKLTASQGINSASITTALGNQWTVGGRVGYMLAPTTLGYVLAGYSEAEGGDITLTTTGGPSGSIDLGKFKGYALGGGIETEIAKNFIVGLEYRYQTFDTRTLDIGVARIDLDTDAHTARLNFVYRFGGDDKSVFAPTK